MANVFTLDALRAETDQEYAPFDIALGDDLRVTLRNPLRLNAKTRGRVFELIDEINTDEKKAEGADQISGIVESCTEILTLVGDDNVSALLDEIDGDAALLIHVIETWTENTQLGEAGNSPESSTSTASS